MEIKKVGRYQHKVYNYYTKDAFEEIVLNKLLMLILDSAGSHANEHNFGKDALLSRGYTWVLSRVNMELHKPFSDLQIIYIDTWIENIKTAFSLRLFEVHDGNGNIFASCTTYWSIIEIKTRKIKPIPQILDSIDIKHQRSVKAEKPHKLVFEKGSLVDEFLAQYMDIDYNHHVNSNKYLDWAMNTYSVVFFQKHILLQIEINYNKEVYYQDKVQIYRTDEGLESEIEIYNKTQEKTACTIRFHFGLKV